MKIALLSDVHIAADQAQVFRGQTPAANFEKAIEQVLIDRPEMLVITGDCALADGSPEDYATLDELLQPIQDADVPIHLLIGNHDDPANLKSLISEPTAINLGNLTLILTNTQLAVGAVPGKMGEAQLTEIERLATEHPDQPMIVLGHHHPDFERNDFIIPDIGLQDTDEFIALLDRTPNLLAYVHGHTHSWQLSQSPGRKLIVNLPPAAFVFDFAPHRPLGWAAAELSESKLILKLRTLDPTHTENGQKTEIDLQFS